MVCVPSNSQIPIDHMCVCVCVCVCVRRGDHIYLKYSEEFVYYVMYVKQVCMYYEMHYQIYI